MLLRDREHLPSKYRVPDSIPTASPRKKEKPCLHQYNISLFLKHLLGKSKLLCHDIISKKVIKIDSKVTISLKAKKVTGALVMKITSVVNCSLN